MKKLLTIILALALSVALIACAAPSASPAATEPPAAPPADEGAAPAVPDTSDETPAELNIGVLVWKYDDAYGSTVRTAMTRYAEEIGNEMGIKINLTMQDAGDSMATQNDQADIMFASKPDFVIINLAEVASGQSLVDKALANDVPFLFYNKEPIEDTIQSVIKDPGSIFIGTTPREAGDMQGEILADLYAADPSIDKNGDGKLQYIMFMGEPNNPEAIARSQYSVETAVANGLTMEQLGETLVCNWDQAQAQDAMTATFANYGEQIEVIFANNDQMAFGAIAALNAVGYNTGVAGDPEIVVIGVDAVDAALESIKAGKMTATVMQDGDAMGKANIRIAINGALGRDWLDGTDYKLSADGYSVRIPYAKITE
ncbi:MAG: galactose ABC transporter substrate-binding protein [Clostridiales bacterium]|jgi:methyl-galactoside transport system substrate-binding protein|nr:galactose ABC transporter substrate-binding protein [Clostridiales bacterium]